jgi:hypothetical protein
MQDEWRFFEPFFQLPADSMVHRFLWEMQNGYRNASAEEQTCFRSQAIALFKGSRCNTQVPGNLCWALSKPEVVEAASQIYSIGTDLLMPPGSGKRYEYFMNIELMGGSLGSTHVGEVTAIQGARAMESLKGLYTSKENEEKFGQLGSILRQYIYSFASTGVPSRPGGPRWIPADTRRIPGKARRHPAMIFNVTADFPAGFDTMGLSTWCSEEAEKLILDIACGKNSIPSSCVAKHDAVQQ